MQSGDDVGLEWVAAREEPLQERIRRPSLAWLQRVVLGANGALLGHMAPLERDLADIEPRGHWASD